MAWLKQTAITALVIGAVVSPVRTWAQVNERPQAVVREAEGEFRRHVNEYQARLRQINFSRPPSPAARRGINDTIVNAYRSHLTAMTRVRTESNARISRMGGVPPAARNNAIRAIGTVYTAEIHTLRLHEEDAMRRLHEAERR